MAISVFHSGEKYIQDNTGESFIASRNVRMIGDRVVGGAAVFLQAQTVFYAASMDEEGNLWASVLSGSKGFLRLPNEQHLELDFAFLVSDRQDVFWNNTVAARGVGLLFIEPISRRRLRINGYTTKLDDTLRIRIDQAYPNCPKYIQRREFLDNDKSSKNTSHDLAAWLKKADTIFIASADAQGNLDVSHRGGNTGFVTHTDENTLRIPDYPGNSMFNTLGNFHVNPAAGMLILDYNTGQTLQMTGRAMVHLGENTDIDTGGTNRFWDFKIEKRRFGLSLPHFTSRFIDFSPYNP